MAAGSALEEWLDLLVALVAFWCGGLAVFALLALVHERRAGR
jgi:hypothetical protein